MEEVTDWGCVAAGVVAGGEVGEVGMSAGGGVSAAAAVDAADLLEPDVSRLNMAPSKERLKTPNHTTGYYGQHCIHTKNTSTE